MTLRTDLAHVVRFGVFELDVRSGELRKSGVRVPLQDQPLEILTALLERPGDVVTRDELRQRLWRDGTFVDFEDGLNAAIRRLRDALGDNATTPRFVETLPRRGYRFIAPLHAEKQEVSSDVLAQQSPDGVAATLATVRWRQILPWVSAAVLVVLVGLMDWPSVGPTSPQPPVRFEFSPKPLAVLGDVPSPAIALSPDGMDLAYVAGDSELGQLYVRRLNSLGSRAVAGADRVHGPFFSPDGQWLAFFTRSALLKVSLRGGSPATVCPLPTIDSDLVNGGSWGDDGSIVFASGYTLWRVSAEGGTPKPIDISDSFAFFPEVLPGSRAIVFTGSRAKPERQTGVWGLSVDSGQLHLLAERGGLARYMRSGHLVYASKGSLVAAPLDLKSMQLTAPPVAAVQDASMGFPPLATLAHFTVSHTGTLAYLPGMTARAARQTLVWVNREGKEEGLPVAPRAYAWPRLARDGSRLAVEIHDEDDAPGNVGIYDLARGSWMRLTSDPAGDGRPLWTPDGQRVVFRSDREGTSQLFWKAADGTGAAERLTKEPNADRTPWSFSPDGKEVVFSELAEHTYDLQVLRLESGNTRTLPRTRYFKGSPVISPDGRWIAYRSEETGRDEVYVRPFAAWDKQRIQVSTNGGNAPLWSADGRELFFLSGDAMMAVPVQTTGGFRAGTPKVLFERAYVRGPGGATNHDVAPDGRRFLMIKELEGKREPPTRDKLIFVLNWAEELRQLLRVPE